MIAQIMRPERPRGSRDFRCGYRVLNTGSNTAQLKYAWGVDTLQALQLAIQALRLELMPLVEQLKWEGAAAGSLGIPMAIPEYFGPELTRSLERRVEQMVESHARKLEEQHRRRAPARRPPQ